MERQERFYFILHEMIEMGVTCARFNVDRPALTLDGETYRYLKDLCCEFVYMGWKDFTYPPTFLGFEIVVKD